MRKFDQARRPAKPNVLDLLTHPFTQVTGPGGGISTNTLSAWLPRQRRAPSGPQDRHCVVQQWAGHTQAQRGHDAPVLVVGSGLVREREATPGLAGCIPDSGLQSASQQTYASPSLHLQLQAWLQQCAPSPSQLPPIASQPEYLIDRVKLRCALRRETSTLAVNARRADKQVRILYAQTYSHRDAMSAQPASSDTTRKW
jgi:hypothetical protein